MARIQISNDTSGRTIVSFPYAPLLVAKVKTIDGRRWHPVEKNWSFSNKDGILEKILKVFEGKEAPIGPTLKTDTPKVKETPSPLAGEGRVRVGVQKLELGLPEALYSCKQQRLDEDKKPFRSDFTEGRMWKPIGMDKRHSHLSLKF
jgi:hypothetical protein